MNKFILAPSMLSADFTNLGNDIKTIESAGVKWLHIDVMDGMFVPNISFGAVVYEKLRKVSDLFFDVHLMIESPERYIDDFIKAGADSVTFHIEATKDAKKCIEMIKSHGKKAAVSICPETPLSSISDILDDVDMVLIMSVHPGFGGQSYIEDVNSKITELRRIKGDDFLIQVDGGIYAENIKKVIDAGANVIVAGTAVFKGDIKENIKKLEAAL